MSRSLLSFLASALAGLSFHFTLTCRPQICVTVRCCAWSASDPSICSEWTKKYVEFQGGLKFLLIVLHSWRGLGLDKRGGEAFLILLGDDHRKCNRTYNLFGIIIIKSLPSLHLSFGLDSKRETLAGFGFYNNFIY